MAQLIIPISVQTGNSLQSLKNISSGLIGMAATADDAAGSLKKLQDVKGPASLRQQIREAENEVKRLVLAFGELDPRVDKAAKKAANLKAAARDAADAVARVDFETGAKTFASSLSNIGQATTGVAGAFSLLSDNSKKSLETVKNLQAAFAFTQGISALGDLKDSFKNVGKTSTDVFKAVVSGISSATAASSGLSTALAATGIGTIVVGLTFALSALYDRMSKLKLMQEAFNDSVKSFKDAYAESTVKVYEAQGALDAYKNKTISADSFLKTYNATLGETFGKTNDVNQAEKSIVDNSDVYIKAQAKKAYATALYGKAAELTAKAVTAKYEDQTDALDKIIAGLIGVSSLSLKDQFLRAKQEHGIKNVENAANNTGKALRSMADSEMVAATQIEQAFKKTADETNKKSAEQIAAEKVLFDLRLRGASELNKKILQVNKQFEEDKKTLLAAGIKDTIALEKDRQSQIAKIYKDENDRINNLLKPISLRQLIGDEKYLPYFGGLVEKLGLKLDKLKEKRIKARDIFEIQDIDKQIAIVNGQIENLGKKVGIQAFEIAIPIKIKPLEISQIPMTDLEKKIAKTKENINAIFAGLGESVSETMAQNLGAALGAGEDPFKALADTFLNSLADLSINLGKEVVVFGTIFESLKKSINNLKGGKILVGLALIAFGAAVKASIAKNTKKAGFKAGGFVDGPGTETSDSIPARLSRGEYVVRARAVRRLGVPFLDEVNNGIIDIKKLSQLPSKALVNKSNSRALVNKATPIYKFANGGDVFASYSKALVNRSSGFDMPGIDLSNPGSRALVNRPLPDTPKTVSHNVNVSSESLGAMPFIAETRVSGQDLKIILSRADRRYSNAT